MKSWFAQMDEDGWIAREQILGDEARSKVPAEFQMQYPHYANPPTLFMVLVDYILKVEKLEKENEGVGGECLYPSRSPILIKLILGNSATWPRASCPRQNRNRRNT